MNNAKAHATCLGEIISVNAKGVVSCQCKDGWSRDTTSDNSPVHRTLLSQGDCFQELADSDYEDFEYDEDYSVVSRLPRSARCSFKDYDDYQGLIKTCIGKNCKCCGLNKDKRGILKCNLGGGKFLCDCSRWKRIVRTTTTTARPRRRG